MVIPLFVFCKRHKRQGLLRFRSVHWRSSTLKPTGVPRSAFRWQSNPSTQASNPTLLIIYNKTRSQAGFVVNGGEIGITPLSLRSLALIGFKADRRPPVRLSLVVEPQHLGFKSDSPHHLQQNPPNSGLCCKWRRDRDSNPRYPVKSTIDFESTAFDHSAISPFYRSS